MTVTLRSRQRPDSGTPELGRLDTRIGKESSTLTESSRRDDGGKPDGATVESQTSRLGKQIRIGTWNVRTMNAGKIEILESEMKRLNLNALGICEHRWKGQGHFTTPNDGKIIFSGRDKPGQGGVGIMLEKSTASCLLGYNPISDRVLTVRLQGQKKKIKKNITLIQVYAPTTNSEDEEAEDFYDALQQAIDSTNKQDLIYVLGDFNAKIGIETDQDDREVKGAHCLGNRNDRGQMLLDFCTENQLVVGNSLFKQHPRRLFTWTSPDGKTKNQIDYILIQKRWQSSLHNAKTYPGADCGSDHELLVATIKMKMRKVKRSTAPIRFDLTKIPEEYGIEISNKFETLLVIADEKTPDELATEAQTIFLESAKKHIPKRKKIKQRYISEESLKLIEERREMKTKGVSQSTAQYKAKSREIKASIRKDQKKFIEDKCKEMEDLHNMHKDRQLFKKVNEMTREFQPALKVIKDKKGTVLTENEKILDRWREYCSEMYSAPQNADVSESFTEEMEKEPEPMLEEIRAALKQIGNGKSPGCDDVPIELVKEGKEKSILLYHKVVLKIWRTCSWPIAWKRSVYIPLPKKGDLKLCSNYRTIALISHASKILLKIIQKRLERKLEEEINIVQAGFRPKRGTRDHIFNIRNILEKCREYNKDLYACFIDYSKAFDCVEHKKMWEIMIDMGFPKHLVCLIENLYLNQEAAVRVEGETSEWFSVGKGVRQGCILSPYLFNIYAENIMRNFTYDTQRYNDPADPEHDTFDSLNIGGRALPELRYADDTVLLSNTPEGLEKMINSVKHHSEEQNLFLNAKKTKIMRTDKTEKAADITIGNEQIEEVSDFDYLGSLIANNGDGMKEIKRRLGMATNKLKTMKNLWKGKSVRTKLKFLRALIFPIATYGSETWSLNKEAEKKDNSF